MSNLATYNLSLNNNIISSSGNDLFSNGINIISNVSGNIINTGNSLQNQINGLNKNFIVYTSGGQNIGGNKIFSGNHTFFDLYQSGSGYTGVSGLVYNTGQSGQFYINDTGNQVSINFYTRTLSGNWNSNNFNISGSIVASASNLLNTGINLVTLIRNLSGQININTGVLTGVYLNRNGDTTTGIFISSGAEYFKTTGIFGGTGIIDMIYIQNIITGNTGIANQYSAAINFSGNTWTGGNAAMNWRIYEAVSSGTIPISTLNFDSSSAGSPYLNQMSLSNNGNLNIKGSGSFASGASISGYPIMTTYSYRAGTTGVTNLATTQQVNFSSPLQNTNYSVGLSFDATLGSTVSASAINKATTGFLISLSAGIAGGVNVDYFAIPYA